MSPERTPPIPATTETGTPPTSKETPPSKRRHSLSHIIEAFRGDRPSGSSPLPSGVTPSPLAAQDVPSRLTPSPSRLTPSPSQLSPRPSQLSPKTAPKRHISQVIETLKMPSRELAERLVRLGFDSETACVLHILPLIQVAWANGEISRRERSRILQVLKVRDIPEGSRAYVMCESMLTTRPTEAFLHASLECLRDILHSSRGNAAREERQLIDLCVEIAEVSGGLFGLHRTVSTTERAVIAEIAATLGDEAQSELRRILN
jgi:tellurite resistance protein